jgi:thioredoxin-related protein
VPSEFESVSLYLETKTLGRKKLQWISVGLLAGLSLSFAMMVGCQTTESREKSGAPKLTPRPLMIPQVWHESIDQALQESSTTGKPVLALFTGSDWCKYCVMLKSDVFDSDSFGNWAKDRVILLSLDYPKRSLQSSQIQQQNEELSKRYKISGYPTVLFLDSQGNVIGKGPGHMKDPQAWINEANAALGQGN